MRALIIAPADVNANAVLRNVLQGMVQGFDMQGGDFQERVIREVGKQHVPRQGKVGTVELQIKAGGNDGLIFRAHRIGKGRQIRRAGRVEIVLQEKRDHTGGGCVHEATGGTMGGHGGFQVADILLQFALTARCHRPYAHRPCVVWRAAAFGQAFQKAGEQFQIGRGVARAVAGKPGVAVLDIGRIGNL